MSATNHADQFRLELETFITHTVNAEEYLRVALLRMGQWARTDYEADTIVEVIYARREITELWKKLIEFHEDKRR